MDVVGIKCDATPALTGDGRIVGGRGRRHVQGAPGVEGYGSASEKVRKRLAHDDSSLQPGKEGKAKKKNRSRSTFLHSRSIRVRQHGSNEPKHSSDQCVVLRDRVGEAHRDLAT